MMLVKISQVTWDTNQHDESPNFQNLKSFIICANFFQIVHISI